MNKYINIAVILMFFAFITSGCTSNIDFGTDTNLYQIKQNNKIGFIDKNGKEIVEAKFDNVILDNSESLIAVKYNGLWGFIDKRGNFKIIPQYKDTKGFKDGLAFVNDKDYEGYIDKSGKFVWKQVLSSTSSNTADKSYSTKRSPAPKNDFADGMLKEFGL